MFFWGGGAGEEGWERKEQGRNGAGSLGSGDWEDLVADALGWGVVESAGCSLYVN